MTALIDLVNEHTPVYPPFGRAVVVVALFACAWLVARLAGRVAALLVDRSERRHDLGASPADTGVISSLKQRQTAIHLLQTSVRYLAFGLAFALSVGALTGARRLEALVGASFVAVVLAFSAQRFLADFLAGLVMFFERWFRVGDTIVVEPLGLQGVVEEVSLRSIMLRAVNGEVMRVHNSEVKAARVIPRGFREFELELFASDGVRARELVEHLARVVPTGPTHFVRRPSLEEVEELDEDLVRLRVRTAVAAGREWLAEGFLHDLVKERAGDDLVVHGPIVTLVDEQATRRFARAAWSGSGRRTARPAEPAAR